MSAVLNTLPLPERVPLSLPRTAQPLTVIVAGNPNAGKTSLFNSLTGLRQKVANYPGVTVESKSGNWFISGNAPAIRLVDLPGLYSLDATSLDEKIASEILLDRSASKADAMIVVADATNLVRNLYLAMQLIETGRPIVLALTMFDLAERAKLKIDLAKLSEELGVPVVPIVAKQKRGLEQLGQAVLEVASRGGQRSIDVKADRDSNPQTQHSKLIQRYARIERIVSGAVETRTQDGPDISERIDRYVTHKFLGPVILLLVMLLVFQAIFSWASLPMTLIDHLFTGLGDVVRANLPPGVFTDLLTDGIIAGVGGVIAFLPQILLLFLFISLLEDSGYMARAAFF
jgi:ferrous iron transport protein B